jgi:hypothetical protein
MEPVYLVMQKPVSATESMQHAYELGCGVVTMYQIVDGAESFSSGVLITSKFDKGWVAIACVYVSLAVC